MADKAIEVLRGLSSEFKCLAPRYDRIRHVIFWGDLSACPDLSDNSYKPCRSDLFERRDLPNNKRIDLFTYEGLASAWEDERRGFPYHRRQSATTYNQKVKFALREYWNPFAEQADEAIKALPEPCKGALPDGLSGHLCDGNYADFFAWFVHSLGWECRDDLPLHINRTTRVIEPAGHESDEAHQTNQRELRVRQSDSRERQYDPTNPLHTYFCSVTPHGLFRCSAYAIDAILAAIPSDCKRSPREPQEPEPTGTQPTVKPATTNPPKNSAVQKSRGGRPKLSTEEGERRRNFYKEVNERKIENGATMKEVADDWGIDEDEGKRWMQWVRDQDK